MNPAENKTSANGQPASPGMNLDDVLFTLFRHKWLILGFVCLGVVATAAVRFVRPPRFVSYSKLMVHYVVERRGLSPESPDGRIVEPEFGGQAVISSEIEILKSLDVATNVAARVGPERILAKKGGGTNLMWAAGAVLKGIEVEVPTHTSVLTVTFRDRDREIVEPVLAALIDSYMRKHNQVHGTSGELDEYYKRQQEELQQKLGQTEEELKKMRAGSGLVSVEETKRAYQTEISKWRDELVTAQVELSERKAVLGEGAAEEVAAAATNAAQARVPLEKVEEYTTILGDLNTYKQRQRESLRQGYGDAHPAVATARTQIAQLTRQKAELVSKYPSLAHVTLSASQSGTNAPGTDPGADLARLKILTARVAGITSVLTNLEAEAGRVVELEPKVNELERERQSQATNLHFFGTILHQAMVNQALGPGNLVNMSVVEKPTPADIDHKKFRKLLLGVFGACVACGLGLAFLIDFVFDRTIKRSGDVERHLRLPVFLTIPDTSWAGRLQALKLGRNRLLTIGGGGEAGRSPTGKSETALALWNPAHELQTYTEGLRERLMTYFDINNMNLKKPKLVGVTGCSTGSGVSTLASGLAAALSKTGDGNVLLVDMNLGEGVAHSFYKGKPGCGLSDVLEEQGRSDAQVQENLYLASMAERKNEQQSKTLPVKFTQMVPKLKASDYDYIIFDLPPASPTSSTPRLASHMDLTLLVVESEKTGQRVAARASALMRESRANVAAVLNKFRAHVPARLSQEL